MVSIQQSLAIRRFLPSTRPLSFARPRLLADVGTGLLAAATALAGAVIALQLWRADLHVPFAYAYDANFNAMLIKGVVTHGWWFTNSNLGAPFGQQLYDFAVGGENLDLGIIRLLGLGSHDPALVMNLFFLLTFPLSAASAYLVLRWAGLLRSIAAACSVLYALTPYHFLRGEPHLFLAADFAVPLGIYLVLAVITGRPLFGWRKRRSAASVLTGKTLATVCACAVVASAGDSFYYAVFTVILVVIGAGLRSLSQRQVGPLVTAGAVVALIVVFSAANLAPTFAYAATHGRNYTVAYRLPNESENYGLKLTELLLPVPGHRIRAFASLAQEYGNSATPTAPNEVYDASLGTFGSLGFVWLIVVLATSALGFRRSTPRLVRESRPIAVVAAAAFLVGTTGGLSALIAYLITPQIRSWNRISIFIAFLSLLALGLILQNARRLFVGRRYGETLFVGALAVIVMLGFADQTTARDVPSYRIVASDYRNDGSFVHSIERRLPPGANVLELPYQAFPEAQARHGLRNYDQVRPYLQSRSLRWSYGAMKGRPQDWERALVERPLPEIVAGAAASGFDGIYIDLAGYGASGANLQTSLTQLLGVSPSIEPRRRALFFDLRPYARRLLLRYGATEVARLRSATLTPPRLQPGSGMLPQEGIEASGHESWWVASHNASFDLYEPEAGQNVVFKMTVVNNPAEMSRPAHVRLTWPNGTTTNLLARSGGTAVEKRLRLRHGHNLVRVSTDAEPLYAPSEPETLYLRLSDTRFAQPAYAPFSRIRTASRNGRRT